MDLRGSDRSHGLRYGGGAALALGGDLAQIGIELYGATPFGGEVPLSTTPATKNPAASTNCTVSNGNA